MSIADTMTRERPYGRVWPEPKQTKRKRFCAWFERGMDIRVKHFKTRRAAHDWLRQITPAN
jgi:DNA primase catalytic subunit